MLAFRRTLIYVVEIEIEIESSRSLIKATRIATRGVTIADNSLYGRRFLIVDWTMDRRTCCQYELDLSPGGILPFLCGKPQTKIDQFRRLSAIHQRHTQTHRHTTRAISRTVIATGEKPFSSEYPVQLLFREGGPSVLQLISLLRVR